MKLQYTRSLASDLSAKHLLLDTTVFINASKSDEFLALLIRVARAGCTLVTIPSVVYEFARTARSAEQYSEYLSFIEGLGVTVLNRIEESIGSDERVFLIAYNSVFDKRGEKNAPSYTDSLLCTTAYKYRTSGLLIMTANHKDIPESIFERIELLTIDVKGTLRNEAIYAYSDERFGQILAELE